MIHGTTRNEGRITVFHLKSDLSNDQVKFFIQKMDQLLEEGRHLLVLDLSEVEHISLMAMVGISSYFNKCRQAGGALKVAELTPRVRKAFRNTNLINTIETYDEVIDAIKSFGKENLLKSKRFSGSFFLKDRNAFVGWDRLPLTGPLN